jgi:hypothetical protein
MMSSTVNSRLSAAVCRRDIIAALGISCCLGQCQKVTCPAGAVCGCVECGPCNSGDFAVMCVCQPQQDQVRCSVSSGNCPNQCASCTSTSLRGGKSCTTNIGCPGMSCAQNSCSDGTRLDSRGSPRGTRGFAAEPRIRRVASRIVQTPEQSDSGSDNTTPVLALRHGQERTERGDSHSDHRLPGRRCCVRSSGKERTTTT